MSTARLTAAVIVLLAATACGQSDEDQALALVRQACEVKPDLDPASTA